VVECPVLIRRNGRSGSNWDGRSLTPLLTPSTGHWVLTTEKGYTPASFSARGTSFLVLRTLYADRCIFQFVPRAQDDACRTSSLSSGDGLGRIAAIAGGEANWSFRPDSDIGCGRKRPLKTMKADVEITSEAINSGVSSACHFINDENGAGSANETKLNA